MAAVTPLSPSSLSTVSSPSTATPTAASTPSRRVTQRAPQSCVFCARRKLRCSKTIPCANCTERGHAAQCHREAVVLSRRTSSARQPTARRRVRQQSSSAPKSCGEQTERTPSTSVERAGPSTHSERLSGPISTASPAVVDIGVALADPAAVLDSTTASPAEPLAAAPLPTSCVAAAAAAVDADMSGFSPQINADTDHHHHTDLAVEAAMSLECLAWGAHHQEQRLRLRTGVHRSSQRHTTARFDHSGYSASDEESSAAGHTRSSASSRRPSGLLTTAPPARMFLDELGLLLTPQQVRAIIHFHQRHVAWMHNVVYMPFFVRDYEMAMRQAASATSSSAFGSDPAWVSLYCAVLCTGVYYMGGREHRQLGLDEGYAVARALYQLAVEAINASDFMVVQSLYSLQAICVLVLAAHAFGDTRRMKVLLACANTMGQGLGHRLHLMGSASDTDHAPADPCSFDAAVNRQVRQRIWCFLCTQDWYLIASKKAYSIVPEQNTTPVPANCREDFDDAVAAVTGRPPMQDCPLSVQTQSTYMIFLFRLTSIYRGLFDELRAVQARAGQDADNNASGVVSACFDHVLAADRRLEAAMGEIDEFSRGGTPSSAQWRALVITSWHQRVMIHRSFFCRSFQDKRYHYSRFVCLAAARKILRSYLDTTAAATAAAVAPAPDTADIEIWSIPTHAISGCIILTLHALFTTEKYTLEKSDVDLVHSCLAVLRARPRPNSIVDRGIRIIQHLLHTTTAATATTSTAHNNNSNNNNNNNTNSNSNNSTTSSTTAGRRSYRRLDPYEIQQLAQDIDMEADVEMAADSGCGSGMDAGARPPVVVVAGPSATTSASASLSVPLTAVRGSHVHNDSRTHSQPDFAQALLNSPLDAFQPRSTGSGSGDDELFMPWWFDSMLNGYGI